jgi:hypothetical protein
LTLLKTRDCSHAGSALFAIHLFAICLRCSDASPFHPLHPSIQDEVVAYVRRRSSAFSRGKSRYRGVSGHSGRWEARIGSFQGRKNVGDAPLFGLGG